MAFLDETGLAELWSLVKAEDAKLAAVDVKIEIGSYNGTGAYGASNPNSLTFGFAPKFIVVYGGTTTLTKSGMANPLFMIRGTNGVTIFPYSTGTYSNQYYPLVTTWNGNTVSWYGKDTEQYNECWAQHNESNQTYHYIAFG